VTSAIAPRVVHVLMELVRVVRAPTAIDPVVRVPTALVRVVRAPMELVRVAMIGRAVRAPTLHPSLRLVPLCPRRGRWLRSLPRGRCPRR